MKFIFNPVKNTLRYNNINISVLGADRVIDTIEQLKNVSLIELKNLLRQQAQQADQGGYKNTAKKLYSVASDNKTTHYITRWDLGL